MRPVLEFVDFYHSFYLIMIPLPLFQSYFEQSFFKSIKLVFKIQILAKASEGARNLAHDATAGYRC